MVELKANFAKSLSNPISKDELKELSGKNSASYMLGFDLDSPLIQKLLEKKQICPTPNENWDKDKGKCDTTLNRRQTKKASMKLKKEGVVFGGEIMYKKDVPKPEPQCTMESRDCKANQGKCVPKEDCSSNGGGRADHCEPMCGDRDSGCVCKMKPPKNIDIVHARIRPGFATKSEVARKETNSSHP